MSSGSPFLAWPLRLMSCYEEVKRLCAPLRLVLWDSHASVHAQRHSQLTPTVLEAICDVAPVLA
jgi:hypothetical protein